jgi:hypothetical protein
MDKLQIGAALAIGALAFSSAQADIVLQNCNGCSTAQVEAMAPNCTQGYTYVSDLFSQNLYKVCFEMDVEREFNPPRTIRIYHWAQPEDNVQQTWQAYDDIYLNNGHIMAADVSIHVDIPPATQLHGDNGRLNAYDTIAAAANSDAVVHYLETTYFTSVDVNGTELPASPALSAAFASLLDRLQVTTPLITTNPSFPVVVVVIFNDGSKRTYSFNYTDQQYVAVPGTARDAHGQLIPENTNMASNGGSTQTYDHSGNGPTYDQPNLQKLLSQFGAKITGSGGGFTTCSWDGVTSTLTCVNHPY